MNITLKNIDPVNATLTVTVGKDDYQPKVEKALNDLRKNIVIDGFRKGNAPKSRIQALYGKAVLVDEINTLVSNSLYDYIKESQLDVLGEPLPSKEPQDPLDFDNQNDYEFTFDLALAPEMDVKLTKSDKLTYYEIQVSDDMIEKQINNFKANYGSYETVETVEAKDMVKGLLTESDGNIKVEDALLMPSVIKDEAEKAKFIGAKIDDIIIFNPYKAYDGHEVELATFLKIKKDEVAAHQGDFTFTIVEITHYKEAELGIELYDEIYEPGTVTSEEAFKTKIKENLTRQLQPESDYQFFLDAKAALEEKAKDIQFPDEFLKRWLVAADDMHTPESVEEDYPNILAGLKFQLIKDKLLKDNDIQVETEDVNAKAAAVVRSQFAQYGISNVSDLLVENQVREILKNQDYIQNLVNHVIEDKLIDVLKQQVNLESKEITVEDFQKLLKK
ncbi:MAG: trigger factor [Candidatus Symbiothrix sp.]|jgi:trigger factor|nr:trigger factor [Candidatus Symbiothrix sp.]